MYSVIAMYDDLSTAQDVIQKLRDNGFGQQDIHLATYDSRAQRREPGGFFESLSRLFGGQPEEIPGTPKNVVGEITSWGVPEGDAQQYAEAVRRGATMVLVNTDDDRSDDARDIMDSAGPIDIQERAGQWQQQGWQGYDTNARPFSQSDIERERGRYAQGIQAGDETTLPVIEEELQVGKREVRRGGTRLYTRVTEHPVEETVNLRDETVSVDRRPADRPASPEDLNAFQEGTFEVTETDEEAVVGKQARVVEEVTIRKDVEQQPHTVRDTVRRTEVEAQDMGAGTRDTDFDTYEPEFRNHYQTTYSNQGYDYNQLQPAYRYGYDLGTSDQYRGRDWNEIGPRVRRDWEQNHPGDAWDEFEGAVRVGWLAATNRG